MFTRRRRHADDVRARGALVAAAFLAVAAGLVVTASTSSASRTTIDDGTPVPTGGAAGSHRLPPLSGASDLGEQDGVVPEGASVRDDHLPAIARLDARLLSALRRAASDAAAEGITVVVNSGWRSARYQDRLLEQAIDDHGSRDEAARWVATPETSAHVSGDAVDVGGADARTWLARHGAAYGLCSVYDNEPWHFEFRPVAIEDGCPAAFPDPTHDPRMR